MNRLQALKERHKNRLIKEQVDKKELIADIKKKAEMCRRLMADKRHKEYREFLEDVIMIRQMERNDIGLTVKDNEEYIRLSIVTGKQIGRAHV